MRSSPAPHASQSSETATAHDTGGRSSSSGGWSSTASSIDFRIPLLSPSPPPERTAQRPGLVRGRFPADDAAIAAREVDRLVAVVPPHPIVLAAAVAGHDLDDLALAAGLADLRALHDDPVTGLGMHGGTSFRICPSLLPNTHTRD